MSVKDQGFQCAEVAKWEVLPEQKMCAAIINTAIEDFLRPGWAGAALVGGVGSKMTDAQVKKVERYGEFWIFVQKETIWGKGGVSFQWCCDAIGIDSKVLRELILMAKKEGQTNFHIDGKLNYSLVRYGTL